MEMLDEAGNVVGFSVMTVSKLPETEPILAHLYGAAA